MKAKFLSRRAIPSPLALTLALLWCARALAQDPVPLETGFTPDPVRIRGQTRGERALSETASGCRGYVGAGADHVLRFDTAFSFLRLFVRPETIGQLTLAVRGPDGHWHCAGRPLEGAPREQGAYPTGTYEIWVGSADPGARIAYELVLTEMPSVGPSLGREPSEEAGPVRGPEVSLDVRAERGRHRDRRLPRGFLPDPQTDDGTAGGAISTVALGTRCRGFVEAQPSHVLTLREEMDYFRVHLTTAEPVVLIVRMPDGTFRCDATDEDGAPSIDAPRWSEGRYPIWVGTPTREATPTYQIVYTEYR